jgi:hypothetical protein
MYTKKSIKKLALEREIIRALTPGELDRIAGGSDLSIISATVSVILSRVRSQILES